jgi:hypothetical protein
MMHNIKLYNFSDDYIQFVIVKFLITHNFIVSLRSEKEIKEKLKEIEYFCKKENYTTEEMQGEIQGLQFALGILNDL